MCIYMYLKARDKLGYHPFLLDKVPHSPGTHCVGYWPESSRDSPVTTSIQNTGMANTYANTLGFCHTGSRHLTCALVFVRQALYHPSHPQSLAYEQCDVPNEKIRHCVGFFCLPPAVPWYEEPASFLTVWFFTSQAVVLREVRPSTPERALSFCPFRDRQMQTRSQTTRRSPQLLHVLLQTR